MYRRKEGGETHHHGRWMRPRSWRFPDWNTEHWRQKYQIQLVTPCRLVAEDRPESLALSAELPTHTCANGQSEQVLGLMFRIGEHFHLQLKRASRGLTKQFHRFTNNRLHFN